MSKFSDYSKSYTKEDIKNEINKESIEEVYNKYSKLDNDSLMNEFIKVSLERKKRGELSDSYFENIKNTLFPYLTEEQKTYYNNLVDKIK